MTWPDSFHPSASLPLPKHNPGDAPDAEIQPDIDADIHRRAMGQALAWKWRRGELRIANAVAFGTPGTGEDLAEWPTEHYPVLGGTAISCMKRPVLVVAGDQDASSHFRRAQIDASAPIPSGRDPETFLLSSMPGIFQGGISGYGVLDTNHDDPRRVAGLPWATWSYLRTAL